MSDKVVLKATAGPITGKEFVFEEHDALVFGRADDCHAKLPEDDLTASRHHFILEVNPPLAVLRDLGSLNGTWVNGLKYGGREATETPEDAAQRRFPEIALKHGDRVNAGDAEFAVSVHVARTLPPDVPRVCWVCKKEVSAAAAEQRDGEVMCNTCMAKAEEDPAAFILKLLMEREAKQSDPPSGIPGYSIEKLIGQGGMGKVYLARRGKDGAPVALKVLLSKVAVDEESRRTFMREIEVTRSVRHPNCVELYEHGSIGNAFYFVMEFCPEGSVDRLMMQRGGRLSVSEAAPILLQALDGLAFAHGLGFVHRDLKPHNILLGNVAKIADFGLAKSFQKAGLSGMTMTGAAGGTPYFMPRELITNFKYAKPVTDVWCMAASFYFMLTGATPRDFPRGKDPIEVVLQAKVVPIRQRDPSIPNRLAEVIDRGLDDNPKSRHASALEFKNALLNVL